MKYASIIAACMILAACHDSTDPPTAVVIPNTKVPPPTYVVFGIVRNDTGGPVFGATAEVVAGPYTGRTAYTNADGYFTLSGVAGVLAIRVFHTDFEHTVQTINVSSDVLFDVRLTRVSPGDTIRLGETIRSNVASTAPPCDPRGWDAMAPCKPFRFTAPRTGHLSVSVAWETGPELDISMVVPPNAYVVTTSYGYSNRDAWVSANVVEGVTYEIRVNAYYSGQTFTLRADIAP